MPDIMILSTYFVDKVALLYKMPSLKREIIQPNIYRILPKSNQFINILCQYNLYAKNHDPRSSGSPDILLTRSMTKYEKGINSVKYSQNFMKS